VKLGNNTSYERYGETGRIQALFQVGRRCPQRAVTNFNNRRIASARRGGDTAPYLVTALLMLLVVFHFSGANTLVNAASLHIVITPKMSGETLQPASLR